MYIDSMPPDRRTFPFPTLPPDQMERIKSDIRRKIRRRRQMMAAIYIIATVLLTAGMIRIFFRVL